LAGGGACAILPPMIPALSHEQAITERARSSAAFWAFVSAFGALWGAFEVTVGAFLHSLRLPMGGVLLAALSGLLLVAGRQVFPVRGSSLAAGVVAALLKSLSPGGVILGPMLGILTEAALVELALLPGSSSLLATGLAGGLATLWAGLQGVLTALAAYGTPIIDLYVRLAQRLAEPVGLPAATPAWLFGGYAGLLLVVGAAMSWLGRRAGRQAAARLQTRRHEEHGGHPLSIPAPASPPEAADTQPRPEPATLASAAGDDVPLELAGPSLRNRRVLAPLLGVALALQLGRSDLLALASLLLALGALGIWGRDALRALWWPRFWALTVLVTLGAGLLLGPPEAAGEGADWALSLEGLRAGARMLMRGALLFASASWAARAVRARELIGLWARLGVPQMGSAVAGALLLLPAMAQRLRTQLRMSAGLRRARLWTALLDGLADTVLLAEQRAAAATTGQRRSADAGGNGESPDCPERREVER